jgi:hypothetical protein
VPHQSDTADASFTFLLINIYSETREHNTWTLRNIYGILTPPTPCLFPPLRKCSINRCVCSKREKHNPTLLCRSCPMLIPIDVNEFSLFESVRSCELRAILWRPMGPPRLCSLILSPASSVNIRLATTWFTGVDRGRSGSSLIPAIWHVCWL